MDEVIKDYDKNIWFIDLDENSGYVYVCNIVLEEVEIFYFMFLDVDDELVFYVIMFYLEKFNNIDGLIVLIYFFII